MKKKIKQIVALILGGCLLLGSFSGCAGTDKETQKQVSQDVNTEKGKVKKIKDMRGKEIEIPEDPKRVAILDKGFLVQSMKALGVEDKICATGGLITEVGEQEERDSLYLFPKIKELPIIGYPTDAVDFETLAAANPDLVILRNSEYIKDSEVTSDAIKKIEEDMKLPFFVINGPGCYEEVKLEYHYEGIRLLGEIFSKEDRAEEITDYMKKQVSMIQERTGGIAEEEKPEVMYIGLRKDEGVGVVWGENFGDAKFSTEYANIKNVYKESARTNMSAEQIITLDPDVMILCTNSVRPDPDILTTDPAYANLQNVSAVKNGKVTSVGLLTWWGDFRLEFPTILLIAAKSAYPNQFQDIQVGQWLNEYHSNLYGLDAKEAQEIKKIQGLDWMDKHQF